MGTIIKTVKQHSCELDEETLKELLFIGEQYKNVKNYVYSRFSGINSILLIENDRKIRDEWTHNKFYEQWKLPARYWKLALSEAISNIKSEWSKTKKRIRTHIVKNINLLDDDRHYINYVLKFNDLFYKVLTNKKFDIPEIFKAKKLNYNYLNNLVKRYVRKYKGNIPYTKNSNVFSIDKGLYSYKDKCIKITCNKKRKRVFVKLTDNNIRRNTLIVKIIGNKLEIHCPLKIKTKKNKNKENIIGIDKGYKYLFSVSTDKFYGEKLNNFLSKETERLNDKNKQRNRFWALYKKNFELGNLNKANKIKENNLGKIKYNRHKNKHDQTVKSYINNSLRQLINIEKPTEIVMEQLNFVNWNKTYPKSVKRKLSRWIKGYIRERLEYLCQYYDINITYINPAYTSKICNVCNTFGDRDSDVFTCPKCGELHADINASKNILNRKYDNEITLYTPFRKVKEILKKRVS
jgi:IS605 OrfB family transposase